MSDGRRTALLVLALALVSAPANAIDVRGLVLDHEGRPLEDAVVRLHPLAGRFQEDLRILAREPRPSGAITRSGADGRFTLEAPGPGRYEVHVEGRRRLAMRTVLSPLVESVELPAVRLARDFPVRVRVRDRLGPIYGASVVLWSAGGFREATPWEPAPRRRTTGEDGTAVLSRGEDEIARLAVLSDDHPEGRTERFQLLDEVEVELERGVRRTVTVRDPEGRPANGALVRLGPDFVPVGLTGEDGRFTVAVPAQGNSVVSAETAGGLAGWNVVEGTPVEGTPVEGTEEAPQQTGDATVDLERPWTIADRVVEAGTERGLQGAWVVVDDRLTRSAAGGRFTLEVPRRPRNVKELYEVRGGTFWGQLRAARRDYLPVSVAISREEKPSGETLRPLSLPIALRPAVRLRGRVVDEGGNAVANAEVDAGAVLDRTDEDGRFAVPARAGVTYQLTVTKDGYAPERVQVVAAADAEPVVIRLWRGRRCFGTVVGPAGRPVAGAEVRLWPFTDDAGRARVGIARDGTPAYEAVTDADGTFAVPEITAGRYQLRATAEGYAPFVVAGVEVVFVPGVIEDVDLGTVVLEYGARLAGRVVDEDGDGLAGARVDFQSWTSRGSLAPWELAEPSWVTTDDDGYFVIPDRTPGEKLDLWAWRVHHAQASAQGVECPNEDVELVLPATTSLRGQVVDPSGRALEGARVSTRYQGASGDTFARAATTDVFGQFELSPLEGGRMELVARDDGFLPAHQWVEVRPGEHRSGIVIRLTDEAAVLEGEVYLEDGKPAELGWAACRQGEQYTSAQIQEGRFRCGSLRVGNLHLEITLFSLERMNDSTSRRHERQLTIEEGVNTVRIDFTPTEQGHTIRGRVVDASGAAVPQVRLSVGRASTVSRRDGTFEITGVPDGRHRIRVERDESISNLQEIVVEGAAVEGVEIVLHLGGAIAGRVHGVEPAHLANVQVYAYHAGSEWRWSKVDYDGRYRVTDIGPGEWTVEANDPGGDRKVRETVEVAAGEQETFLDLEFRPGTVLHARIVVDGVPEAGAQAALMPLVDGEAKAGLGAAQARTDFNGVLRIEGLEDGPYRLLVRGLGDFVVYRDLRLPEDGDLQLDVRTAALSGRIVDGAGRGVDDVAVQLFAALPGGEGVPISTHSDSDGSFAFRRLVEGGYVLKAERQGWTSYLDGVVVHGGANAELTVVLERQE